MQMLTKSSLAFADLLYGIILIIFLIFQKSQVPSWCGLLIYCIGAVDICSSCFNMSLISLERYYAIKYPCKYRMITYRKQCAYIAVAWALGLPAALFVLLNFYTRVTCMFLLLRVYLMVPYFLSISSTIAMCHALYIYKQPKGKVQSSKVNVLIKGRKAVQTVIKDDNARHSRLVITVLFLVLNCILTRLLPLLYTIYLYCTGACFMCPLSQAVVIIYNLKPISSLITYIILDRSFQAHIKNCIAKSTCNRLQPKNSNPERPSSFNTSVTLLTCGRQSIVNSDRTI